MRYQKTEWGIKLINFKERWGMTLKDVAEQTDVSLSVLRQVMIGKTPGYQIVETIDNFMSDYEASHTPKPLLKTFDELSPIN